MTFQSRSIGIKTLALRVGDGVRGGGLFEKQLFTSCFLSSAAWYFSFARKTATK